jgi:hypothetical protein
MSLERLIPRGYVPRGGMISSNGTFCLNIPKNASTFLTNVLHSNLWEHYILGENGPLVTQAIVVLRDPVERWISGFATYASSWLLGEGYGSDHFVQHYNTLVERLIFDNLIFDDHTTPQSDFVDQLPVLMHTTYFYLDQNLIKNISEYTGSEILVAKVDANVSEDHYDQQQITKFIRDRLNNRPDLIQRINEQYANDFTLLDSVQFYNDAR